MRTTPPYDQDRQRAEKIAAQSEQEWRAMDQLNVKAFGAEGSIKTSSLNTVATVATLMIVTGLAVAMYQAGISAREARDEFKIITREVVSALREMTQATREQNCLMAFPPERREANMDLCKRVSR